jgi:hypothetical protein
MRHAVLLASCLAIGLASRAARADDLRIETIEHGTWPAAVAHLQRDRDSEGSTVHVVVKDDQNQRLKCGTYSLAMDPASAEAFTTAGCDEDTNATSIRLIRRSALFTHDDRVPHPRAPRIQAQRVQVAAAAGGAQQSGGSVVSCTADVRPFIDNLESGSRAALTPGRYELRVKNPDVDVTPVEGGWRLVSHATGTADVVYDVYDGKRNEVVFHDHVRMACEGDASASPGETQPPVHSIEPARVTALIDEGSSHDGAGSEGPAGTRKEWNGHAWTLNVMAGPAYMRPSGLNFSSGGVTEAASVFGLNDVAATAVGISGSYERPGIYTSIGGQLAYVKVNDWSLIEYGVMSTVAAALHISDTTLYLGPHVALGSYTLGGVSGTNWSTPAGFSLGAATGVRVHFRDQSNNAWVVGGEVVAPVVGGAPWLFLASIGFGGAR